MSRVCDAVGPAAAHLEIEHQAPRAGDLRLSPADISHAKAVLGYAPQVALTDGLKTLVTSLREGLAKAA